MNSDGNYEERDRITARTKNYQCNVQITEVRENSFRYLVHLDPEMEGIQQVTMRSETLGDNLETLMSGNHNRQIGMLLEDGGWEGSHTFESPEAMATYENLDVVVRVTYRDQAGAVHSNEEMASVLVGNPFYEDSVRAGTRQSVEALKEEVENLKSAVGMLREELESKSAPAQNIAGDGGGAQNSVLGGNETPNIIQGADEAQDPAPQ